MEKPNSKRAMFVWLPNFAMRRARLKRPALAKPLEPLVLLEKHGNIRRIAGLDAAAAKAGLYLHQPLADALAVFPALKAAGAEPDLDREALCRLALWAQRYTPATATATPDGLWLDVTGCAHLIGGEAGLAADIIGRIESFGFTARAAIAPTFGAAFALAHHAEQSCIAQERELPSLLSPLPVERLRLTGKTTGVLKKLGLLTIGDLQNVGRKDLERRFPDLLPRLDQAIGRTGEAIAFLAPVTPWVDRLNFAEPVSTPEDIARTAAKLLEGLCNRLELQRQGATSFETAFFRADGDVHKICVTASLPTRDPKRLFRLFREKLQTVDPGFGIDAASLTAAGVEPLGPAQTGLLRPDRDSASEDLPALVDSLKNRLGPDRVYRIEPRESHIPERAVKRVAPLAVTPHSPVRSIRGRGRYRSGKIPDKAQNAPFRDDAGVMPPLDVTPENPSGLIGGLGRSGIGPAKNIAGKAREASLRDFTAATGSERPVRLFAYPEPVDVTAAVPDAPPVLMRWRKVIHRIARADGPERIAPEWWLDSEGTRGQDVCAHGATRDYYRVETAQGLRFWVYRQGAYGAVHPAKWYLHGVFG